MSLPKYPFLFRTPDSRSISGTVSTGLRRTSVPVALANQTQDFNSPRTEINMSFAMTNDELSNWVNWLFDIGWGWFLMDIVGPYTPRNIVSTHTVRIMSPLQQDKIGDNWYSISAQFEVVQNDAEDPLIPGQTFNWVVSGPTWSPPVDWVVAGAPSTPSLPVIISHLYYRDYQNG